MKLIKFTIVIGYGLLVATSPSCSPVEYRTDTPNPLDEPGYKEPTASERHLTNIREITSNRIYQRR